MKRILLLTIVVLTSISSFAQRLRYEDQSNFFFGVNMGNTWHTSDVQNIDAGIRGAGFLFGASFNHDYHHALSFDLRFRYLGGRWYGQDSDTTNNISGNTALSNAYGSTGYAVQNFRASQHRAALELAIHLNSLRQRTGLDPYIFGGIGYTWTRVMGDLRDNLNEPYNYTEFPSGAITQGNFDAPLDMDKAGVPYPTIDDADWRQSLIPSIGFGLGYYFTNRFSMGFEHKTTFFQDDYFDGTIVNQDGISNGRNDIYHYTSIYARWYLRPSKDKEEPREEAYVPPVDDHWDVAPVAHDPPRVVFTLPTSSPTTVNTPTVNLNAQLSYVSTSQDVFFRHNGAVNHDYIYVSSTGVFTSSVQLQPGQNVFRLRGTNPHGSDEATMVIIYEQEEEPTPPIVTITDPTVNPYVTEFPNYNVKASIKNVTDRSQVNVTVNGQVVSDFDFSSIGNNNFFMFVNLVPGPNTIRITGTNQFGTDNDEVTIIYKRSEEQSQQPPVVTYSNPVQTSITVNEPNFTITGSILHVEHRNQVSFIQNGTSTTNFNFSSATKQFSSNVVLQPGANIFQLIGTNTAGTDQKTVVINYDEPAPTPPIVTITNPAYQPHYTASASFNFKARVLNVDQQSQISVTFNGSPISDFTYSTVSKEVNANLALIEGANTVQISATNDDGSDSKSTVIIYEEPTLQLPPVVTYVIPGTSPETTDEETAIISASVEHVEQQSQIHVVMNGTTVSDFAFNSSNQMVSFTRSLQSGANTITITGTNEAGSDSKSTVIIYKKREVVPPPVVTFIDPNFSPTTVYEAIYNVKARVQNVANSSSISLTINGVESDDFSYSASSEIMEFTTSLNEGANSIVITATNEAGTDVGSTTIIFKRPQPITPPLVTISVPISDGYESAYATKIVYATVLHVDDVNQIAVYVNETRSYAFEYDYITKQLELTAGLQEGENKVTIRATNPYGTDYDTRIIKYNPKAEMEPPYVEIVQPAQPNSVVTYPSYTFVGTVENVDDKSGIRVEFNGQVVNPNFYSFNSAAQEVRFSTQLIEGNNSFRLRGTNEVGAHQAATSISYEKPASECKYPIVNFIDPDVEAIEVSENTFLLEALVHYVDDVQEITFKKNGGEVGNFAYDMATHQFKRLVTLVEGSNVFELSAHNKCGRVSRRVIIRYNRPSTPCDEPIISVVQPTEENHPFQTNEVQFFATISDIKQMNQVGLFVNNKPVPFSFDIGSHVMGANLPLVEGENTVIITAQNECGDVRKTINIMREACVPPTSNLELSPEIKAGKTAEQKLRISGSITDIVATTLNVKHNGSSISYLYNEEQQLFSSELNLKKGTNTIQVRAESRCGVINEQFEVVYEPAPTVEKPTVVISDPKHSPYETEVDVHGVTAQVNHIAYAHQISVTVNQSNTHFEFDANSGIVNFDANLMEGNNTVRVAVANESGNASDQKVIVYKKPIKIDPPTVSFTSPEQPMTSYNDGMYQIKGVATSINSKQQLELYINNELLEQYTANVTTDRVEFSFPLQVSPSHSSFTLRAKAANEAGMDQTMITIQRSTKGVADRLPGRPGSGEATEEPEEEAPCDVPEISYLSPSQTDQDRYNFKAKVTHVSGSDISVLFNGTSVNCSYNHSRNEISCYVNLDEGNNEFIVTADGCETSTSSFDVNYKPACSPVKYQMITPSTLVTEVEQSSITLNVLAFNVTQSGASATVNGRTVPVQVRGQDVILPNIDLNKGANTIQLVLRNECSMERINYTVTYQDAICGPYVNPGSADWQFCMQTPSGTFNRSHIHNNPRFNYAGSASSVYFLALAGGQDVTVNGKPYRIRSGVYYHFQGNLTVQLRWQNNRWMLCLDADRAPAFGSGNKRPESPCELNINRPDRVPNVIQEELEEETQPDVTPSRPRRVIPSIDQEPTSPEPTIRSRTIAPNATPEEEPTEGDNGKPLNIRRIGGRN